jgi:hypothetical protein
MDKTKIIEGFFLLVSQDFLRNPKLTLDEKALYLILETYSNNEERKAFPSIETLEKLTGHFNKKIIRIIKSLEQKGYLEKKRERDQTGKYGKNFYFLKNNQATKKQRGKRHDNYINNNNNIEFNLSFNGKPYEQTSI